METVFAVLIFISFLISLFKYIPAIQNAFGKEKMSRRRNESGCKVRQSKKWMKTDDLELIAVYSAIAATEETTTDGFVVRSIKPSVK